MYPKNSQNCKIPFVSLTMDFIDSTFEYAFKEVFQAKDSIIGEDPDDNMNIAKENENINKNQQNFAPEIDSIVNIQNINTPIKNINCKLENIEHNLKINQEMDDPYQTIIIKEDNNNEKEKIEPLVEDIQNMKIESSIQEKKINPFRVYNSCEFNIFHPGGNCPSYNKIKEDIKDLDKIQNFNFNRFKVHKKSKIRRKRNKKEKIERKRKPDNIRKKIKSRFFKSLKIRINQILKNAKSEEQFDLLPQCFIINITKKMNKSVMNMSLKQLFSCNFVMEELYNEDDPQKLKEQIKIIDLKKYERNKKVIEYLENNDIIVKNSKFNIIGNMTFTEIFDEYLKSDEFEKEILKLEKEGNDMNYIKDYIVKAFGFINYFH